MLNKTKIYQIGLIVSTIVCIGLIFAMGIIATQKSMKLKMSFPVTPNFLFEVYIQKEGSPMPEIPAFRNFEKSTTEGIVIQNGFSTLKSNTLSADGSLFSNGDKFSIIIKNYTTTVGISVSVSSSASLENGSAGVPAEITAVTSTAAKYSGEGEASAARFDISLNEVVFPQQTLLEIKFSELNSYAVTFSDMEDCFVQNAPTEVKIGDDFNTTITPQTAFAANYFEYDIKINDEPYTHYGHSGTLEIPAEDIVGDIEISVSHYECWDGTKSGEDYTPVGTNSTATYSIGSPADLAQMIQSVKNKNKSSNMDKNPYDVYDNVTFNLTKDIYLNDEDFIFEEETGYVYITDGIHEAWLGTGAKGTTRGNWRDNVVYAGVLYEWETIDYGDGNGYTGVFHGNGYIVSGIYQLSARGGLFGTVGAFYETMDSYYQYNSEILNIRIVNGVANGGSIAEGAMGEIINCSNDSIVLNGGGLVGDVGYELKESHILNCFNNGNVIGSDYLGGISGIVYNTTLSNCVNTGKIIQCGTSYYDIGGIAGSNGFYGVYINNCYNLGQIQVEHTNGKCAGIYLYSDNQNSCYFLQTDTINAGLEVYPNYTDTDCGTISSIDAKIPSITITSLDGSETKPYSDIKVLEALNKAVELTASSEYKTWESINPPKFGSFWSA